MNDVPIKDVSDTAFMVAMYRAMEGDRPDALFQDPLSLKLAGERGRRIMTALWGSNWVKARHARIMMWHMAVRTHIIDRFIAAAIAEGANAILNLGAGLDTRPYRMALPGTLQWIEIDYAHVIELKESQLAAESPRCQLERIKLDLTDRTARLRQFAAINSRFDNVLVLTEGVILYLTESDVGLLADDLRAQTSFRQWIADHFSRQAIAYRARSAMGDQMQNAPFLFDPDDYFGFFQQHGWQAQRSRYLWDEGASLGRPMPLSLAATVGLKVMLPFLPQEKADAIRKAVGYVVFEPDSGI
jgi:methyltransferase (TIGR00027 family)